jgi:hypothetical protein
MRRVRTGLLVTIAACGLCLAGAASFAADDDALIEQIIAGLEQRDQALSALRVVAVIRSVQSDAKARSESGDGKFDTQSRALHVLDFKWTKDEWSMDTTTLVSDGNPHSWGDIVRLRPGRVADENGRGGAVARSVYRDGVLVRWDVASSVGQVREGDDGRAIIWICMDGLTIWTAAHPAGEYFREHRPELVGGPVLVDGVECYHIRWRTAHGGIGPFGIEAWVAPSLGYWPVRVSSLELRKGSSDRGVRYVSRASDFREVAAGVWFPRRTVQQSYVYGPGIADPWWDTVEYSIAQVEVGPEAARRLREQSLPPGVYVLGDDAAESRHPFSDTRTVLRQFERWLPPPPDDEFNRPLTQAEVDALTADVASAEAAGK